MSKATEKQIQKIYETVFKKIYTKSAITKLSHGSRIEIIRAASMLESSKAYNEFATKFAKELSKKGLLKEKGIWRKYYKAAKALHYIGLPKTWSEFEKIQMEKAILHNFDLIKSIPRATLSILEKKYATTLIEQVAQGKISRGSFEKELRSHGHKNAKLIARTEAAKLQTSITENRSKDLGSVAYIWRSSSDKRTRKSHREMNGVVVFWKDDMHKPLLDNMRGNAGEFPNCRCTTLPIFNELDLDKPKYRVYDYRTDAIILMKKDDILTAITNGTL